jgi:hypothetical protein
MQAEKLGQRRHFCRQCGSALAGDLDPGPRPAAVIALLRHDQPSLLQHRQVPRQVAGCQAERVAQVAELGPLGLRRDSEDAEPVPLVDPFIDRVRRVRRLG